MLTSWALIWRFVFFWGGGVGVKSILQLLWVVSRILFLWVVAVKSVAPQRGPSKGPRLEKAFTSNCACFKVGPRDRFWPLECGKEG